MGEHFPQPERKKKGPEKVLRPKNVFTAFEKRSPGALDCSVANVPILYLFLAVILVETSLAEGFISHKQ